MARQAGPLYFTGTLDGITFYKMEGEYLARKKSSLTRQRFRTDPRFARSRKSAEKFGEASKLASTIYWQLPKEQRGKGVVNTLTGQVGRLLKEGKTVEEVLELLLAHCQTLQPTATLTPATCTLPNVTKAASATNYVQQPGNKEIRITTVKQARYLSYWKVNKRGHLHIPKSDSGLPIVIPLTSQRTE